MAVDAVYRFLPPGARELRKKHGLSIRSLGKKLGVADSYLSRVERNLVPASDKLLLSLTEEFQAPELFRLAGKIMPADFMLDSGWREKIIKVRFHCGKSFLINSYTSFSGTSLLMPRYMVARFSKWGFSQQNHLFMLVS
jgi:transcriptional regulator with XRE-family HTH domain